MAYKSTLAPSISFRFVGGTIPIWWLDFVQQGIQPSSKSKIEKKSISSTVSSLVIHQKSYPNPPAMPAMPVFLEPNRSVLTRWRWKFFFGAKEVPCAWRQNTGLCQMEKPFGPLAVLFCFALFSEMP